MSDYILLGEDVDNDNFAIRIRKDSILSYHEGFMYSGDDFKTVEVNFIGGSSQEYPISVEEFDELLGVVPDECSEPPPTQDPEEEVTGVDAKREIRLYAAIKMALPELQHALHLAKTFRGPSKGDVSDLVYTTSMLEKMLEHNFDKTFNEVFPNEGYDC